MAFSFPSQFLSLFFLVFYLTETLTLWYKYLSLLHFLLTEKYGVSGLNSTTTKNKRGRISAAALVLFVIVTMVAMQVLSGDGDVKPKRPRFDIYRATFRDNKTGLMWSLNGGISEMTLSWEDAREYVAELNKERFAGTEGWRLPSREEIRSLVAAAQDLGFNGRSQERTVAAVLQSAGIKSVQPVEYWSATVNMYNASEVWYVSMRDGSEGTGEKTLYLSVWPVRSLR